MKNTLFLESVIFTSRKFITIIESDKDLIMLNRLITKRRIKSNNDECRRTRATRHSHKRRHEKLEATTKVAEACDSGRLSQARLKAKKQRNRLRYQEYTNGSQSKFDKLQDVNPNIIGEIKAARLRWLGHVERMGEDRAVKRAYLRQPIGRRPVGRPRYRWSDEVQRDLQSLSADGWRDLARDRRAWRHLVSEAKIHFGSLRHNSNTFVMACVLSSRVVLHIGITAWSNVLWPLRGDTRLPPSSVRQGGRAEAIYTKSIARPWPWAHRSAEPPVRPTPAPPAMRDRPAAALSYPVPTTYQLDSPCPVPRALPPEPDQHALIDS
ncbi:unnamed protein product [Chilo suppressalis]|uniref:Uncharacterized protein n=1 Tax=Chilo suppressalis TaxID=168631 RepID=A0ABN8AY19_CHISP|nr:unnamed protein product [Chilo suppressalis]